MGAEKENEDLLRLNALVDGELAPAERAAVAARLAADRDFARAYATLARLKACVMDSADHSSADIRLPEHKPSRRALGLAAAAIVLISIAGWTMLRPQGDPFTPAKQGEIIALAALPARPVIPDLDAAGLTLSDVNIRKSDGNSVLIAAYSGPRGCRLELRVRSAPAIRDAVEGTSRHAWNVGTLAYELVAFGMPETRFAIIAGAAERLTRLNADPADTEPQLRQARVAAPPCVG